MTLNMTSTTMHPSSPLGFLSDSDHSTLHRELKKVKDYFTFGLNLGIKQHVLEKIEADHPSARRRLQEICAEFIRSDPRASWSHVVTALQDTGEERLADKIERKHLPMKQGRLQCDIYTLETILTVKISHNHSSLTLFLTESELTILWVVLTKYFLQ